MRAVRTVLVVALCVASSTGCASWWRSVRENDRQIAVQRGRQLAARSDCQEALVHLERGQASPELGSFGAESTFLKARCLDRLGRKQEALAHWRMLRDFYADSRYAQGLAREERDLGDHRLERPIPAPRGFEIPKPRYSERAERARVTGAVWVEYDIPPDGDPAEIVVVQMSHPLLASWAIEAVASAKWAFGEGENQLETIRATSRFAFVSYWADQEALDAEDADEP